jgi:hypothetical protein
VLSRECFKDCTPATGFEKPNPDCEQPHCQCLCHLSNARPQR